MERYYVEYKRNFAGELRPMTRSYSTLASAKRYARKMAYETGYARVQHSVLDGYRVVFEASRDDQEVGISQCQPKN